MSLWAPVLGLFALAGGTGCTKGRPSGDSPKTRPAAQAVQTALPKAPRVYPKGNWRLVPPDHLDQVVLWVSHILIRHRATERDTLQQFRAFGWDPDGDPPERSKREALTLAQRIAREVQDDASRFATLARRHSDDLGTRDRGGSMGGVRASQLGPAFLDALQTLRPGESSAVFETTDGFHIVQLRERPLAERLSGTRIAIRYAGTVNSEVLGEAQRSREEAFALARHLRESKEPFEALVQRFSEHPDRQRKGDMGVWSSDAPEHNGPALEVLAATRLGEISQPFDSRYGVQILRRDAPAPRVRYAADRLQVAYDARKPPASANSRESVLRQVSALIREVKGDPSAFVRLLDTHCCRDVLQWDQGTGDPALEAALASLSVGAVAREPVDIGWFIVVPRRLDPHAQPPSAPLQYALPDSAQPDLDAIVEHSSGEALSEQVALLSEHALSSLKLSPPQREALVGALGKLQRDFATTDDAAARVSLKNAFLGALEAQLGAPIRAQFEAALMAWARSQVLNQLP